MIFDNEEDPSINLHLSCYIFLAQYNIYGSLKDAFANSGKVLTSFRFTNYSTGMDIQADEYIFVKRIR